MSVELSTSVTKGDLVDAGFVVLALLCIALGAWRGLSGELALGTSWGAGLLAGWYAYPSLHAFYGGLPALAPHPAWTTAAALATALLLAWGLAALVRLFLSRALKAVARKPPDHVLGALFGLLRAAVLILIVTAAMLLAPWPQTHEAVCHQSRIGRRSAPLAASLLVTARTLFPHIAIERAHDPSQEIVDDIDAGSQAGRAGATNGVPRPRR